MPDKLIDRREPGFYIVDNEVIDVFGAKIGVYGVAVYNVLLKFSNSSGENAFPSYQKIADLLGISRPKAIEAVKTLVECGLIDKTPRMSSSGDPTSNVYTLLDVKKMAGGSKQDLPPSKQDLPGGSKQNLLGSKQRLPDQDPLINTQNKDQEEIGATAPKLTDHPAIQAYRDTFLRYPPKAQIKAIVDADPDIGNWVRAVREWNLRGFSPTNIKGMLEWTDNPKLMERYSGNSQKKDTMRNKGGGDGQVGEAYRFSDDEVATIQRLKREAKLDPSKHSAVGDYIRAINLRESGVSSVQR